jgi:hypothetical protein
MASAVTTTNFQGERSFLATTRPSCARGNLSVLDMAAAPWPRALFPRERDLDIPSCRTTQLDHLPAAFAVTNLTVQILNIADVCPAARESSTFPARLGTRAVPILRPRGERRNPDPRGPCGLVRLGEVINGRRVLDSNNATLRPRLADPIDTAHDRRRTLASKAFEVPYHMHRSYYPNL